MSVACWPMQIPGVLTRQEADKFVAAAEAVGFQHSTSRGAAYGEVRGTRRRCPWRAAFEATVMLSWCRAVEPSVEECGSALSTRGTRPRC